jgi:hypothetical protein
MEVTTADGKLHSGNLVDVTESAITLTEGDKDVTVAKADVSRIAFVRERPLSDSREYNLDELGPAVIFDPDLYPRLFHIGDTMSVRLYDSSMTEDNSPVACQ